MQPELAGMTAGIAATVPMTAAMAVMHRLLPEGERYALPPRELVDNATGTLPRPFEDDTGLEDVARDRIAGIALASHFAFGAMAGTAYGSIARTRPASPAIAGVGFGLIVWVSQYLGVLPAVGLLSSAVHHPARRNALMIAAHVVWGAALGVVADRLVRTASD